MLDSTLARTPTHNRGHPVAASKRRGVESGRAELNRAGGDAPAVGEGGYFDKRKTEWTWYLIGVECDVFVEERRTSQDPPPGLVEDRPGVRSG